MLRAVARHVAGLIAPKWLRSYQAKITLVREARRWQRESETVGSTHELVRRITREAEIYALQEPGEISRLLDLLAAQSPSILCEIGTFRGGNLLLFSRVAAPTATIISIDIDYGSIKQLAFPHLARPGQQIYCLHGDSHTSQTFAKVRKILGDRLIDFLFIDGDHTLQGVKTDYEMYSLLMRPGGIIALHDIVPDNRMRYGIASGRYGGEVPLFWQDVKLKHPRHLELIDNPEQDGCGIGVLWTE